MASYHDAVRVFLSTPSARRATARVAKLQHKGVISIHALREEGDAFCARELLLIVYFYPRPPRGGRQQKQREIPLLLFHYTPLCTNCKEMPVKQTAKSHRYLYRRPLFQCEASRKTMCASCSHWRDITRTSKDQHTILRKLRVQPNMLDLGLVIVAQLVEPQTV